MTEAKYNGWKNYATWRVATEIMNEQATDAAAESIVDSAGHDLDALGDHLLQDWWHEFVFGEADADDSTHLGQYALAFLEDVSWVEIAQVYADRIAERGINN